MDKRTAEDREEEAVWRRSQERQTLYREGFHFLRIFFLALAIILAGKSVGEGISAQGERAVQRSYECTVRMQSEQLERLFRSPTEKG